MGVFRKHFLGIFLSAVLIVGTPAFAEQPFGSTNSSIATIQQATPEVLLRNCAKQYFSRSYANFFACANQLERDLTDGNNAGRYRSILLESMRAELLLEIGQPKAALEHAHKAYNAIPLQARKWSKISDSSQELDEFKSFLKELKQDWSGDALLPLVPEVLEVVAKSIGLLARCYYLNGDVRRAEYLAIELALFDDAGYRERIYFAFVRNKFSDVVKMKEAKEEEIRQVKSSILVVLFSPERPTYEFWENYNVALEQYLYGKSLLELGQQQKSAEALDKLLDWKGLENFGGLYWGVLYERARLYHMQGNQSKELEFLQRAVDTIESIRSTISLEAGKLGFAGDKQAVYQQLVRTLASREDWTGVFDYAERAKARALVDMLSQQVKISAPPSADEKVLGLLAQANTPEASVFMFGTGNKTRSATLAMRDELGKLAPEAASLVSVPSIPIKDIASRLNQQETLINYFNAGNELFALVINGTNIKGYKIDSSGIEKDIRDFRDALEASDKKTNDLGQKLYLRLIAPILKEIKGKELTISPHGFLHYLPFAALTDGNKYLLENYSVRIMPSASALVYVRTDKPKKAGKLLALGNPDLGDAKYDLPGAQKEAVQVANLFSTSKVLVRKEASKRSVKEFGSGFSILHIASHGIFDSKSPLNSGLLLASNGEDTGRLTVGDLYSLQLDAELVTLSACETGLGKLASGDDVVGLTRGFLYAGARSIISSLWKVDDESTRTLMTNFYTYLAKNVDQREALRLAQMKTKEVFPHPFYWAAFQITGAAN